MTVVRFLIAWRGIFSLAHLFKWEKYGLNLETRWRIRTTDFTKAGGGNLKGKGFSYFTFVQSLMLSQHWGWRKMSCVFFQSLIEKGTSEEYLKQYRVASSNFSIANLLRIF